MLKAFDTLIELAQTKSDTAAVRMAKAATQLGAAEQKAQLLLGYRDDYRARLDAASLRGAPIAELANFRAFLAKLDEAVGQQEAETAFWREQSTRARTDWQGEQKELQSYTTIATRRRSEIARAQAKRDQKTTDEFAARAGRGAFAYGK